MQPTFNTHFYCTIFPIFSLMCTSLLNLLTMPLNKFLLFALWEKGIQLRNNNKTNHWLLLWRKKNCGKTTYIHHQRRWFKKRLLIGLVLKGSCNGIFLHWNFDGKVDLWSFFKSKYRICNVYYCPIFPFLEFTGINNANIFKVKWNHPMRIDCYSFHVMISRIFFQKLVFCSN